jgi:hypothetical protein
MDDKFWGYLMSAVCFMMGMLNIGMLFLPPHGWPDVVCTIAGLFCSAVGTKIAYDTFME